MSEHRDAKESRLSPKLLAGIIVALFFGVALCLRICLPYDQVFGSEWIKFTSFDAYYHMRIVDNLVHNFPRLISFDPYMLFPGVTGMDNIHFFDWLLAGIIRVISPGSPSQHTIDVVGTYFPAILGALTVIPIYFIGKALFNRWVGVISAGLIALMPGDFLGRSILGFTDHDIAGMLFTTVTMLFLILAIKAAREKSLTFSHLKHRDRAIITKPIIYSLLAGVFLGIYLFTWPGALLFVLIIFIYFVIQFIIDHLRRQSTDYLCLISVILFLVATLMFAPTAHQKVAPASLVIALLIPLVLSGISRLLAGRQIKPAYYPLTVVGLGVVGVLIFRAVTPALFNSTVQTLGILIPRGAYTTTLEMQPLTLEVARANFTTGFFLSFIVLGILIYLIIKRGTAEKSLLLVWSVAILVIALVQRRFAGYLAINVALLTGYLSALIFFVIRYIVAYLRGEPAKQYLSYQVLESVNVGELAAPPADTTARIEEKKARPKKKARGGSRTTPRHASMALAIIVVLLLAFLPNILKAVPTAKAVPFAPSDAWCQSLSWLKANTADPFGDPDFYYEPYPPDSPPVPAYSVLAWWDYGYWITRMAHRVPNTNPAQGGVGEVANFLLSQDEDSADEIRGRLSTKYVIIDYDTVTGKFYAIASWAQREQAEFFEIYYQSQEGKLMPVRLFYPEYYHSLATRMYNFDGEEVTPRSSLVISYQERMNQRGETIKEITDARSFSSYEKAAAFVSSQPSANYRIVSDSPFISPVPLAELKNYRLAYSSDILIRNTQGGMVPSVKIFEYVP
jgi:oligosaccharyl transferase (archaeosortase A-associated)